MHEYCRSEFFVREVLRKDIGRLTSQSCCRYANSGVRDLRLCPNPRRMLCETPIRYIFPSRWLQTVWTGMKFQLVGFDARFSSGNGVTSLHLLCDGNYK